jgi:hypothetical protein
MTENSHTFSFDALRNGDPASPQAAGSIFLMQRHTACMFKATRIPCEFCCQEPYLGEGLSRRAVSVKAIAER